MRSYNLWLRLLVSTLAATVPYCACAQTAGGPSVSLSPAEMRLRHQGNLTPDGAFSFWTRGELGDWLVADADGPWKVSVLALGKTIAGKPPRLEVALRDHNGQARRLGVIEVDSSEFAQHELTARVPAGCYELRLRHLNRVARPGPQGLRHLLVKQVIVVGALRSDTSPVAYGLLHGRSRRKEAGMNKSSPPALETEALRLTIDPAHAQWSLLSKHDGRLLQGLHPVFQIDGADIDLPAPGTSHHIDRNANPQLGDFDRALISFRGGDLDIDYTLLVGQRQTEALARVDFVNRTDHPLTVHRVAAIVAPGVRLGENAGDWMVITDDKANSHPYQRTTVGEMGELAGWWYLALKDPATKRSVLLGNATNSKGLGRFIAVPNDDGVRLAAYNDYEDIFMPPGARVQGEWTLLHLGQRGTDSLDRLGELIARAHDIDLMKQHPINPYDPDYLSLFTGWNSYGSAVVKGFPYQHDRQRYEKAFMDPEWRKRCRRKLFELGLDRYGYALRTPVNVKGTPTPLARRYGKPDFWFKDARRIAEEHPELYVGDRIDFSNPATVEYERQRAAPAFQQPDAIIRYSWDFTNDWRKLDGQHVPFMTSADTFRAALGVWRELGKQHPRGAYGFVWMNIPGLCYDRCDVIHIGHDSDQGYGGRGLTFTHGLTRQISGRYYLNGRVWWNSPDSFHVYCGGIYSYQQAKVHASFCSIAGNLVHLGEPLADEEMPEERLEILRRVAPTTPDVATAVDLFEHCPARLWNMPVRRPFGKWNIVGLFNVDFDGKGTPFTEKIRFADLGLHANASYLVYEFWSRQLLGVFTGSFTRTLSAPDCEVYAIHEALGRPQLLSTNRHVRQMAYDVRELRWDMTTDTLAGESLIVADDAYELRIHVPEAYRFDSAQAGDLTPEVSTDGPMLLVTLRSPESRAVRWQVAFRRF